MAGDRYERELVNTLDACGFVAMRAPASGSSTERDLPDVLAMRAAERVDEFTPDAYPPTALVFAVEVKATSKNAAYVEPAEVAALERFADTAGAETLLGARFKNNGEKRTYLVRPENAGRTQGDDLGNYSVHVDDAPDDAAYVVNASAVEVSRL
jgi:Holliday junction resolvase